MKLSVRIVTYLGVIAISAVFYIHRAQISRFNGDEFQHTYLAWSASHYGQVIYRDVFDNHGPISSWINAALLLLSHTQPGLECFMWLRYVSLFFLMLSFLACFELMRMMTGNPLSGILLPSIYIFSQAIGHAFEVRPDNLQTLFLTIALICLALSMKDVRKGPAIACGVFLGLMLLTNLKALVALPGIYAGLAVVSLRRKEPLFKQIGGWLLQGLIATLLVGCGVLYLLGALRNYYFYNVAVNFLLASDPAKSRSWDLSTVAYINHRPWLTISYLVSLGMWFVNSWRYQSRLRDFEIVLGIVVGVLICGKAVGLWLQYDLIFLSLLGSIVSWLLVEMIQTTVVRFGRKVSPFSPETLQVLCVMLLTVAFSLYYCTRTVMRIDPAVLKSNAVYFKNFRDRLNYVAQNIHANETVESFEAAYGGLGFQRHASYLIVKSPVLMKWQEYVEGKKIYGQDYIRMFDEQRVKFIFGRRQRLEYFPQEVQDYVRSHYRYQDWLWERTAPFRNQSKSGPVSESSERPHTNNVN